jgi:hypothetical protein
VVYAHLIPATSKPHNNDAGLPTLQVRHAATCSLADSVQDYSCYVKSRRQSAPLIQRL